MALYVGRLKAMLFSQQTQCELWDTFVSRSRTISHACRTWQA